jgi:type I restriction enzyme, R subunit
VIVDAVGITDEERAWADSRPLDREPTVNLKTLPQRVAEGVESDAPLSTMGSRLLRLDKRLRSEQREDISEMLPGGGTLAELAGELILASDSARQRQTAVARITEDRAPTEEEVAQARQQLVDTALAPLADPKLRQRLLDVQLQTQQIIDLATQDQVVFAGFKDAGAAQDTVQTVLAEHHDECVAISAYFEPARRRRLSLADIRQLARAIEAPPMDLTPEKLWMAYETLDASKVRGEGGRVLTDIVSLVRYALKDDPELIPHQDVVRVRFDLWLTEQQSAGRSFTEEQQRWLQMVRDHIATFMSIEPDDFDLDPFAQEGGLDGAYTAFGDQLTPLLDELNTTLAYAWAPVLGRTGPRTGGAAPSASSRFRTARTPRGRHRQPPSTARCAPVPAAIASAVAGTVECGTGSP